jgi:dTDP-4-dehydrorhamnose reductase
MRFLVTGASGLLGGYLLRELAGQEVVAWSGTRTGRLFGVELRPVDLADPALVAAAFRAARPDVVLHAAALAAVADCLRDPARAEQVNTQGTARLAELAGEVGARLLLVSTDLVFDGAAGNYTESDVPAPLSTYGRSKWAAEAPVRALPRGVAARLSLLFGPSLTGRRSFFDQQLAALRERRPLPLFVDEWRTPLALHTAAQALVALAQSDFVGLLHLGGPERMSRLEMGQRLAALLGLDPSPLVPARRDSAPGEPRPRDVSLDSGRWRRLCPAHPWPGWEEAVREMLRDGPAISSAAV